MQLPSYDLHPSQINVLKNTNSKTFSKRSDAFMLKDSRKNSSKRFDNEDMPDLHKDEQILSIDNDSEDNQSSPQPRTQDVDRSNAYIMSKTKSQ